MLSSVYWNEVLRLQWKLQEFIGLSIRKLQKKYATSDRSLWQRFNQFSNFLDQQLQNQESDVVPSSFLCALVVQRVPYQMKQLIFQVLRQLEAQFRDTLSLVEPLELYNSLIHHLEISQGAQNGKEKPKAKKVGRQGEEHAKPKVRSNLKKGKRRDQNKMCLIQFW